MSFASSRGTMTSGEVDPHNAAILKMLKDGDLVEFPRDLYSHWGVYVGDQQIAHLTGIGNGGSSDALNRGSSFSISGVRFNKACVKIEDFFKVAQGCKARRNNDKDAKCTPLSPNEIIKRAWAKVGEIGYNIIWHNCEHFAAYLRYDKEWSEQVDSVAKKALVGGAAVAGGAFLYKTVKGSDKKK